MFSLIFISLSVPLFMLSWRKNRCAKRQLAISCDMISLLSDSMAAVSPYEPSQRCSFVDTWGIPIEYFVQGTSQEKSVWSVSLCCSGHPVTRHQRQECSAKRPEAYQGGSDGKLCRIQASTTRSFNSGDILFLFPAFQF